MFLSMATFLQNHQADITDILLSQGRRSKNESKDLGFVVMNSNKYTKKFIEF